jgi:hypothetical protein
MNAAFRDSVRTPVANRPSLHEPPFAEDEPEFSDVVPQSEKESDILNIKNTSADEPPTPLPKKKHPLASPKAKSPTRPPNRYQALVVEEVPDTSTGTSVTSEATCARQPRRPRWERRLPLAPKIGAAEVGRNSLYLRVEVESTSNQWKYGVRALVDSGATGLFIDQEYVKSNQIPTTKLLYPIPVRNVDGTPNTDGAICKGDCRFRSG